MYIIQQITTDFKQQQTLVLPDGTTILFQIKFIPLQGGWFIDTLTYGSFTIHNLRICNSPNMLHQFRNIIPFGLTCFSSYNREPSQQEDFSSGASIMYLLSAAEVNEYATFLVK